MDKNNKLSEFIYKARQILFSYYSAEFCNKSEKLSDIYPIEDTEIKIIDIEPISDLHVFLSEMYEKVVPLKVRKDYGKFYTKDKSVIEDMIANSAYMNGKILEPACGTGMFLVELVRNIIIRMKKKKKSEEEIVEYLLNNIYGVDTDCYALELTEINIVAEILPLLVSIKKRRPNYSISKFKLIKKDFTDKTLIGEKFSLVIGNPPFVTMYGKRSRNMTEKKRAYYNTFDFVQNKTGNNKFNLSMFFVENGLKHLIEGGQLYYILDISFFETAYIDLRRYIVKNYWIESITKGIKAFDGVASGQVLVKIHNVKEKNKKVRYSDFSTRKIAYVNQNIWDNEKEKYKYNIPFEGLEKEINDKIKKNARLDAFFPRKALRTCCALTGRTKDFEVSPNEDIPFTIYPYIEGSKGLTQKFGNLHETKYIKYDYDLQIRISNEFKKELEELGVKNKKRVTLGDKSVYDAPKLFIRQSASEIIATYTEKPYAANNSIYVLSNKDYTTEGKDFLKYVCGILNSELITFYCHSNKIIRMGNGKTPQIKTSDLKDVRIRIDDKLYPKLVNAVNNLLVNSDDLSMQNKLNAIVYSIYNISEDEQRFIKEYEAAV